MFVFLGSNARDRAHLVKEKEEEREGLLLLEGEFAHIFRHASILSLSLSLPLSLFLSFNTPIITLFILLAQSL